MKLLACIFFKKQYDNQPNDLFERMNKPASDETSFIKPLCICRVVVDCDRMASVGMVCYFIDGLEFGKFMNVSTMS